MNQVKHPVHQLLPPGTYTATSQDVKEEKIPSTKKKEFVVTAITLATEKVPRPCKIRMRYRYNES